MRGLPAALDAVVRFTRSGTVTRIRIVTFGLIIPAEAYTAHAVHIAPEFTAWPGLLGKGWFGDTASGTFGGLYLFSSQDDADRSRETDVFSMFTNPAPKDVRKRGRVCSGRPW